MSRFLAGFTLVLLVVAVIVIIDVVTAPTPAPAQCALDRQILLPDSCAGNCDPGSICLPVTTRPYLSFFSQAATCTDLCSVNID